MPWQLCQFHVQQNAQKYVPRQAMKREVAAAIRAAFNVAFNVAFNAADRPEAERQLELLIERYRDTAPKLAEWAARAPPETFTVFAFPEAHRHRIRTSNMVERLNKELKRRTRVATLFPNEAKSVNPRP